MIGDPLWMIGYAARGGRRVSSTSRMRRFAVDSETP
jgi:hypothetical protein